MTVSSKIVVKFNAIFLWKPRQDKQVKRNTTVIFQHANQTMRDSDWRMRRRFTENKYNIFKSIKLYKM